jgi:heat shock protein HslJ
MVVALGLLTTAGCGAVARLGGDPLAGTAWEVASIGGRAPIAGTTVTVTFQDGSVGGSGGCNAYGGSYRVKGDTIMVGALASTEMACLEPTGAMEQEAAFLAALGAARMYRLTDDSLELVGADGQALTLTPRQ